MVSIEIDPIVYVMDHDVWSIWVIVIRGIGTTFSTGESARGGLYNRAMWAQRAHAYPQL